MHTESKRIVSQYNAAFNGNDLQWGASSDTAVRTPLLGNGDMGVTFGRLPEAPCFYISKNDFWRLKSQAGCSGPRVFGGIKIEIPDFIGAEWSVEQDLYQAVTVSRLSRDDVKLTKRIWVAATENVLVIELSSQGRPVDVELHLWAKQCGGSTVQQGQHKSVQWAVREFCEDVDIPVGAACAMRRLEANQPVFKLHPGEKATVVIAMKSSFESKTFLTDVQKVAADFNAEKLETLREKHSAWWQDFWAQSFVEIGDPLIEQRYYLSNYVMGSCSRNPDFPPPLFGTWITTDNPDWYGDYHLNYNHQAPYYALYSSNHVEQAYPYHAPILDFMERGKWYARNVLNCRGVYYPVGIGPKGIEVTRNTHGYPKWLCQKGGIFHGQRSNAAYSAVNIAMHWYHTYDKKYASKVYPFVSQVAAFWEDYMKFEDGRYVIYNDCAHEGSGEGKDFNPIVSLGLVRMIFTLAMDMSKELGIDADRHAKWNHILTHISDFPTQMKNDVKVFRYTEKGTPWWPEGSIGVQHIYPIGAIGPDSDPELLEIARNTIRVMSRWIDFNCMSSFYSAAVRVGYDTETILKKLRWMIQKVGAPNGFIKNNPHGIENCSVVPNAINEMLCTGFGHVLRIFPVWPRQRDARFVNLRTVGAFLVSSELKNGRVQYVRITSTRGKNCTIENPWPQCAVTVLRNGTDTETITGTRFTLKTHVNEVIQLTPNQ